jgi:hypothetical protein
LQSAIGSIASAAEQAFIPYAERVLELMKNFMVLTNDEDLRSRARATELVGMVAMSVGKTRMEPILPPYIEAAISVITFTLNTVADFAFDLLPGIICFFFPVIFRGLVWSTVSFGSTHMDSSATLPRGLFLLT